MMKGMNDQRIHPIWFRVLGVSALLILPGIFCLAQSPMPWNDVTEEFLVEATTQASWFGTGMSAADFNLDGREDLTFSNSTGSVVAYVQLPDGGFELAHEIPGEGAPQGVAWFDVDGDDDLDLMVGRRFAPMELHINEGDVLVESAESHGIPQTEDWEVRGLAVADYDKDGDLDVYVCMYHDGTSGLSENLLLNNDGEGNFNDVTSDAGVGNGLKHTFQAVWFDHDGDDDLDLWVINDRQVFPNAFYENLGNGVFQDVAESIGLGQFISAMTATIGDPDNDGDQELFCTDVENEPNIFLEKAGGFYTSVESVSGLDGSRYSWGGCWVDADGDMWSDLMVATYRFPNSLPYDNYYYHNAASGVLFEDQTEEVWPNEQTQLYCLALCDFNQDLAPDVVCFGNMPYVQMLENQNTLANGGGGRLVVQLCGTESNRWAVGAEIRVHAGGQTQLQTVTCGSDYMTQQSWRRFFGVADAQIVDSVVVDWPSGLSETWFDVPVGSDLRLVEGSSTAELTVEGTPCPNDSAWLVFPWESQNWQVNGELVEGDSLLISGSGTYVAECSWMDGLFEWTGSVEWLEFPPHEVTVEWTEPLCAGEVGWVGWTVDSSLSVLVADEDYPSTVLNVEQLAGEFVLQTINPVSGCTESHSFALPEPSPLGLYLDYEPALCPEDVPQAIAVGYGGSPGYLVNWNGADPSMLEEGWVDLTLTDDNGCVIDSSFWVQVPSPIVFDVTFFHEDLGGDGAIQLGITGGTAPYDVLWNTGQTGDTLLADLTSGLYSWVVTDANGCTALGLQEIINLGVPHPEYGGEWDWNVMDGTLTLQNPTWDSGFCSVQILDLTGRLLHSESWMPNHPLKLEIGHFASRGVVSVRNEDGQVVLRGLF